MSVIRSSSYIVYKSFHEKAAMSHKKFTLKIIEYLMAQAYETYIPFDPSKSFSAVISKSRKPQSSPAPKPASVKRPRFRKVIGPSDLLAKFPERCLKPRSKHLPVKAEKRGGCIMCAAIFYGEKKAGTELTWDREVKRTSKICGYCSAKSTNSDTYYLCKEHFIVFHDTP